MKPSDGLLDVSSIRLNDRNWAGSGQSALGRNDLTTDIGFAARRGERAERDLEDLGRPAEVRSRVADVSENLEPLMNALDKSLQPIFVGIDIAKLPEKICVRDRA